MFKTRSSPPPGEKMKKKAAHTFFGRGGPKVVSLLGAQQADKSAARTHFSEHFGCVSAAGDPQALPEGQRRGQKVVGDRTGNAGLC